ncbi:PHA/PHB synthase family protein [Parvularcula dongshanensis]|uniref:Polyhydroxyalkanoate synthase n=1 Tax=Parvularcula dongshanensis TaxID=1173995 RepID=A0A840I4J4_9PROT|nr:class I poly(R)-hydroxyalkanoic acid synthase [Parvularcula dongshanensis]MBB4659255.1 polyhydroxyalkanoate synthase [Parvularcula dongshanensis]
MADTSKPKTQKTHRAPKSAPEAGKNAAAKNAPAKKAASTNAAQKKAAAPAKAPTPKKTAPASAAKPRATKAAAAPTSKRAAPAKSQANEGSPPSPEPVPAPSPLASPKPANDPYRQAARFAETVADVNARAQNVMREVASRAAERGPRTPDPHADPLNVTEAAAEVGAALAADPVKLAAMQMELWGDYMRLFTSAAERMSGGATEPVAEAAATDKRWRHPAWSDNPALDFVKQSYLLMTRFVDRAIGSAEGVDEATRRRAHFHADQFMAAFSPTNVPGLNPEVVEETINSGGENWTRGLKNYLADLERGHGELAIRQADMEAFEVGVNVATTPGKVIYQNDLIQLIQYAPTTKEVAKRPLVIFPPWINKFYILDLQPENSFIRWAVDQGRTVLVVSWVNPGPELQDVAFPGYMRKGVYAALDAAEAATGADEFDAIGYCIGGTLLAVSLGHMAATGDERIKTATFFTAQTDFSEAGDLKVFVDDKQLAAMERQMDAAGGVLEASAMARTFNMLRPNDLIWQAFVDNYYLGKAAKKFDLLFWNADATRMTKACQLYYLRNFYRDNALAAGTLEVEGVRIDLSKVTIPTLFQAGEADHIAPARSVFRSAKMFGGAPRFLLAGSGHIAGVVNPPAKKKYHYAASDTSPGAKGAETLDEWAAQASRCEHSWWPYWDRWLTKNSPGKVAARQPGGGRLTPLEDAPGSFVRVRSE